MNIKVLGTGCPKCKRTTDVILQAIAQSGIEADVEKVEDIERIMTYNILTTPAVVVDGRVVIKGRVPTIDEVKAFLLQETR